jgi:hypothetical protein
MMPLMPLLLLPLLLLLLLLLPLPLPLLQHNMPTQVRQMSHGKVCCYKLTVCDDSMFRKTVHDVDVR